MAPLPTWGSFDERHCGATADTADVDALNGSGEFFFGDFMALRT
jgi:hypothetical protein